MREFLAKFELIWMVPFCALVAVFSVFGLYSFDKSKAYPVETIEIEKISSYRKASRPDEIYCASKIRVDPDRPDLLNKYSVWDAFNKEGARVSLDTECVKVPNDAFLTKYLAKGMPFQGIPVRENE